MEKIVLAYAGEPPGDVAVARLRADRRAGVVTVTLDVGQRRDLDQVREQALEAGAVRAHVLDVREEFARAYILPALQAGALYGGRYPMTSSLARPLIARKLVEIARIEGTPLVAHSARGRGTDLLPLDLSVRALAPELRILTPAREAIPADTPARCHVDENLWGRSVEHGMLEDAWVEPPESLYQLTKSPTAAPDAPAYVAVTFHNGVPSAVNGVTMAFTELIESLTTIAGGHGVGRMDTIEQRQGGIVSREICEAPAAIVLHVAHRELETLVLARDLERLKRELSLKYADLVYNGLWFTPMREALDAFTRSVQPSVSGTIRMRLFKGTCDVVGRRSAAIVQGSDMPVGASELPVPSSES